MGYILDLEELKRKKGEQDFAETAIDTITYLLQQMEVLEEKTQQLEEMLKLSDIPEVGSKFKVESKEMEIIKIEFARLYDAVVQNGHSLDRDDLKKFDTLVKCFVALKNGVKPKKVSKKEKEESEEELLKLIKGEFGK